MEKFNIKVQSRMLIVGKINHTDCVFVFQTYLYWSSFISIDDIITAIKITMSRIVLQANHWATALWTTRTRQTLTRPSTRWTVCGYRTRPLRYESHHSVAIKTKTIAMVTTLVTRYIDFMHTSHFHITHHVNCQKIYIGISNIAPEKDWLKWPYFSILYLPKRKYCYSCTHMYFAMAVVFATFNFITNSMSTNLLIQIV